MVRLNGGHAHIHDVAGGQNLVRRAMAGPGHIGRTNLPVIFADLDLGFGLRHAGHQGMKVTAGLRRMTPVGMLVERKIIARGNHVANMPLPSVPPLVGRQPVQHGAGRRLLQFHVERGVDPQSALVHLVGPVLFLQIAPRLLHKVRRHVVGIGLQMKIQRPALGLLRLLRGDAAVLHHVVDDQIAAAQSLLRIVDRRVGARPLGQPRQQRRFLNRQLLGGLAEVELRARFKSIHSMPQKNLVGVEGEDLFLGEAALDLDRHHDLLHLAPELAVRTEEQVARQLHGQRGCTLGPRSAGEVAIGRAHDAPQIDPPVPLEILVFNGDDRVAQNLGIVLVAGRSRAAAGQRCRSRCPSGHRVR